MLVTDNPTLAWLYREELEEAGFRVRVQPGISEAMGSLQDRPADVLVTDDAPVRQGMDLWLRRLRAVHGGGVVILDGALLEASSEKRLCVLDKSSDLRPLISSVRRQALSRMWSRAAGTC